MDYNEGYWPYYSQYREMKRNSYIRLLHASPGAPPVDVLANDKPIAQNLSYKDFTQYLLVPSGNYNIKIYPAGKRTNPLLVSNFFVPPNFILTLAAAGQPTNITLVALPEPLRNVPKKKVYVRLSQLSPDAPNVDVALQNGRKLFTNVSFKEFTDYVLLNPGTYNFEIRPTGTTKTILYVPNITLKPDRFYTVYTVGLASGRPPLQALIPMDGNSYLKF